jgi:hypothetical protein
MVSSTVSKSAFYAFLVPSTPDQNHIITAKYRLYQSPVHPLSLYTSYNIFALSATIHQYHFLNSLSQHQHPHISLITQHHWPTATPYTPLPLPRNNNIHLKPPTRHLFLINTTALYLSLSQLLFHTCHKLHRTHHQLNNYQQPNTPAIHIKSAYNNNI